MRAALGGGQYVFSGVATFFAVIVLRCRILCAKEPSWTETVIYYFLYIGGIQSIQSSNIITQMSWCKHKVLV